MSPAGTIDFGGGVVTANMNGDDVFVAKFSATGTLDGLNTYGTSGSQFGIGLALDPTGTPTIGGEYSGVLDFGNGVLPAETGDDGAFLARITP